jgi:hypothetical protein
MGISLARRRLRLLLAVLLMVASCGGLGYLACAPRNGIWVWWLRAELREQLPVGSTREQAEEWLSCRGYWYQVMLDPDGGEYLYSYVPNSSFLEDANILIHIYFDGNGRVREHVVLRGAKSAF